MNASDKIKDFIKSKEGLSLSAYVCPAGVLTIGYGHTGKDVAKGMRISQSEAELLFEKDIKNFEVKLNDAIGGILLKQCQYDTLLSFAYNVGIGALSSSTLLRKAKANPADPTIGAEFEKWVYATVNGRKQKLPGLIARRSMERQIWEGKVW